MKQTIETIPNAIPTAGSEEYLRNAPPSVANPPIPAMCIALFAFRESVFGTITSACRFENLSILSNTESAVLSALDVGMGRT